MKQAISMHGWCCDSTFWTNWEQYFQNDGWLWKNAERGYGNYEASNPVWDNNAETNMGKKKVIFCHSLGIHLVPSKILKEASDIILINSFSRFIPNDSSSRAVRTGLIGMQKHLGKTTESKMLFKFLTKANQPYKIPACIDGPLSQRISDEGRKQLVEDFNLLIKSHELPKALSKKARILAIQGKEDKIISPQTSDHLISDLRIHMDHPPTQWHLTGEGHIIQLPGIIKKVSNWLKSTK